MNPWRNGSVLRNPYHQTAFRVARLPVQIARHRAVVQYLRDTMRFISSRPGEHAIAGEPVTEAILNQAEQVLLDAPQRIVEELLEHPVEKSPLDDLRRLAAEWKKEISSAPVWSDGLNAVARELVEEFLQEEPPEDVCAGDMDRTPVPPFGRLGGL